MPTFTWRPLVAVALCSLALAACNGDGPAPGATARFTHGVAAGDVTPDRAILWTRAEGGDTVTAEITTDPTFDDHVRRVEGVTSAGSDFTVKVVVEKLKPDTEYHYRFRAGGAASQIGTFRTAPAAGTSQPLRFIFTGDADGSRDAAGNPVYNNFEVLDTASREGAAFFLFVGDTIYADRDPVATTLEGYRGKYQLNREYAALNRILGRLAIYTTWDDHEVVNDFAGATVDPAMLAAGRRAFREYMPVDDAGDEATLYRAFRWGSDVDLIVLDERGYRSGSASQTCGADTLPGLLLPGVPDSARALRAIAGLPPGLPQDCVALLSSPSQTMLGDAQMQFLEQRLTSSDATWKVIVNEVPIQQLLALPYDRWEAYAAERADLLRFIRDNGVKNVVFLTTDMHATIFGPVRIDLFTDDAPVAYEAVTGPIATTTLQRDIEEAVGPSVPATFSALLTAVAKVDCVDLNSYSYGLVEVDPQGGTLTISSKDAQGKVLCSKTLTAE